MENINLTQTGGSKSNDYISKVDGRVYAVREVVIENDDHKQLIVVVGTDSATNQQSLGKICLEEVDGRFIVNLDSRIMNIGQIGDVLTTSLSLINQLLNK